MERETYRPFSLLLIIGNKSLRIFKFVSQNYRKLEDLYNFIEKYK